MHRRSLACLLVLTATFPWLQRGCQPRRNLPACRSNVHLLSIALEMYASDNDGRYPTRLEQLVLEKHLTALPICPEAGFENYSATYQVRDQPDAFTVGCRGRHHGDPSRVATRDAWWERHYSTPEAFPCYFIEGCTLGICPYD